MFIHIIINIQEWRKLKCAERVSKELNGSTNKKFIKFIFNEHVCVYEPHNPPHYEFMLCCAAYQPFNPTPVSLEDKLYTFTISLWISMYMHKCTAHMSMNITVYIWYTPKSLLPYIYRIHAACNVPMRYCDKRNHPFCWGI